MCIWEFIALKDKNLSVLGTQQNLVVIKNGNGAIAGS